MALPIVVAIGGFGFVSACDSHPRQAKAPEAPWLDETTTTTTQIDIFTYSGGRCLVEGYDPPALDCVASPRFVKTWGPVPNGPSPDPHCPMRVRVDEHDNVIAEPFVAFDPMPSPGEECIQTKYRVGQRRVLRVDDGAIVAYAGAFDGDVFFEDGETYQRTRITSARYVGFARAPSGTILALGVGRARLGRGGVVALEHHGRGEYVPRLIATLPVEPSAVSFDDHGRIVTFAQGFIVRIDENGRVENLHYVSRDVGRINSIARTEDGVLFLGLECGVLRLVPRAAGREFYEEWWSAKDGASGHWSVCD